jgi:hypothetical protein
VMIKRFGWCRSSETKSQPIDMNNDNDLGEKWKESEQKKSFTENTKDECYIQYFWKCLWCYTNSKLSYLITVSHPLPT